VPVLISGQVVGAGHLQRRLDRLAAAGDGVDPGVVQRQDGRQLVRVRLDRLGRERGAVDVRDPAALLGDRVDDLGDAVPDSDHDRAAGAVQVAPAGGVDDLGAGPADHDRQLGPG
jgi:hypothetical protein